MTPDIEQDQSYCGNYRSLCFSDHVEITDITKLYLIFTYFQYSTNGLTPFELQFFGNLGLRRH